ncbi:hypothetical protein IQ13_1571 [Lacibacter cauensis]|uniref:DUF3592 domain-containing protein n=1 Tax=Lacibacter cauensis TaxID=510947 RepID=A0A562SQC6_9BACT|nr:DUF3592 domain-containing protein [Lacibacter cauensis]TWI83459.1 hypothetical protein IQ13_1571 [Lacibacter cauensis]
MTTQGYLYIIILIIADLISYRIMLKKSIADFFRLNKLITNGDTATGEVIDIIEQPDLDDRTQYAPLIRYVINGIEYKYLSDNFSFNKPILGSAVSICYNNNNPYEVIDSPKTTLLFKAFIIIFILVVMAGINFGVLYNVFFS